MEELLSRFNKNSPHDASCLRVISASFTSERAGSDGKPNMRIREQKYKTEERTYRREAHPLTPDNETNDTP